MQDYRDNSSANSDISRHLRLLFEQGKPTLQLGFQFLYFLLSNTDTIPQPKGYHHKPSEDDVSSINNTRCGHLLNLLSETPTFRALFPNVNVNDDEEEQISASADETEPSAPPQTKAIDPTLQQNRLFRKLKLRHALAIKNPFLTAEKQPCIPPKLFANNTPDKSIDQYFQAIENSGLYPSFHNHPEMLIPFLTMHALLHEMQTIVLTCDEILTLVGINEEILSHSESQIQINQLMSNFKNLCEALKNCHNMIVTHTENVRGKLLRENGIDYSINSKSWIKNFAQLILHKNDAAEALRECATYCDNVIADIALQSSNQQPLSTTESTGVFTTICTKQNNHIKAVLMELPNSLRINIQLPTASPKNNDDQPSPYAETDLDITSCSPGFFGHIPTFRFQSESDDESTQAPPLFRQESMMIPEDMLSNLRSDLLATLPPKEPSPDDHIIDLHGIHVTAGEKIYRVLTDESVTIVKDYLRHKPLATTLLLMKNNIGGIGTKRLCTILSQHLKLETLNMSDNPTLFSEVKKNGLNGGDTPAGWVGAKAVAGLLKTNICLKNLLIGNTGLTDHSLTILSDGLAVCTALEIFDISNNAITDMGIASICDYLQQIPTLCQVLITNNKLTDVCGNRLLRLLEEKPQIIILDIRDNEFSAEMLERINAELKINQAGRPPAPSSPTLN